MVCKLGLVFSSPDSRLTYFCIYIGLVVSMVNLHLIDWVFYSSCLYCVCLEITVLLVLWGFPLGTPLSSTSPKTSLICQIGVWVCVRFCPAIGWHHVLVSPTLCSRIDSRYPVMLWSINGTGDKWINFADTSIDFMCTEAI